MADNRTRLSYLAAGMCVCASVYGAYRWDAARKADHAGAVAVEIPNAPLWWASASACLGDASPYPRGVKFYVGTKVPGWWVQTVDESGSFLGYTNLSTREVMLAKGHETDSGLVAHEVWHTVHGGGHPASVFDPPRCGLAAP